MKQLTNRQFEIASGNSELPMDKVLLYRKHFAESGFELPQLRQQQRRRSRRRSRGRRGSLFSSFDVSCRHLGEVLHREPCTCGASSKVDIHVCHGGHKRCVQTERLRSKIKDESLRIVLQSCDQCSDNVVSPEFISVQQFGAHKRKLASMLPPDVTTIVGIARSGLSAATDLSMLMHLPLAIIRQNQGDVISAGNGWRLEQGAPDRTGKAAIIDDTCMTGNSLRAVRELVQQHFPDHITAVVYCNPKANEKPHLWVKELSWPHILEWNLFNSVLTPACAFDFDGILCEECPVNADDDGESYLSFLDNALPLYPVRRTTIPMIVTARLEKYRKQTEAWLAKWRMKVDQLVMGPWKNNSERSRSDVAAFKASHYREFMKRRVAPGPHLFIESDARQAQRIADLSGGVVVCPAAGRCFP